MIDAINEEAVKWDEQTSRWVWPTDGRTLSGTIVVLKEDEGDTVVSSFMEIDLVDADGTHVLTPVLVNEVHPFFAGYAMANPWQRVGQSAYNAVDIVYPGLLEHLPEGLDIFEIEETDDPKYIAFWTWVATAASEGHPVTLHLTEEGMKASWDG